jgi:hypothetical protein
MDFEIDSSRSWREHSERAAISLIAVYIRPISRLAYYIGLVCALSCTGCRQAQDIGYENHPGATMSTSWSPRSLGETFLPDPIFVYNNWSSYDELSDNVLLTEELSRRGVEKCFRLTSSLIGRV